MLRRANLLAFEERSKTIFRDTGFAGLAEIEKQLVAALPKK
jgi:hypothetical protein